jgi:hypothetical protein
VRSNDRRVTHTDGNGWDGFMKFTSEMGSGTITIRAKFHKDWFRHSNNNGGIHTYIYRHSMEIT